MITHFYPKIKPRQTFLYKVFCGFLFPVLAWQDVARPARPIGMFGRCLAQEQF
jgi:hypothetical protein